MYGLKMIYLGLRCRLNMRKVDILISKKRMRINGKYIAGTFSEDNVVVEKLDNLINWARAGSPWFFSLGWLVARLR